MRQSLELGIRLFSRRDLEAVDAVGEKLAIKVLGLATIAQDVSADLALASIESITVLGALHASKDIKNALAELASPNTPTTISNRRYSRVVPVSDTRMFDEPATMSLRRSRASPRQASICASGKPQTRTTA